MSARDTQGGLIYSRKVLWFLFLIGTLVSVSVAFWLYRSERLDNAERFRDVVEERVQVLDRELNAASEAVYTLREVIAFVGSVPQKFYEDVAGSVLERKPGLLALAWLPRVESRNLASFEREQQGYVNGYRVMELNQLGRRVPARGKTEYFPVSYVMPLERNRRMLGLDYYKLKKRAEQT